MRALSSLDNRKRLLLETDSAYLANNPWCIIEVAEEAAWSLNMTVSEFAGICNKNAARLYSLPWYITIMDPLLDQNPCHAKIQLFTEFVFIFDLLIF